VPIGEHAGIGGQASGRLTVGGAISRRGNLTALTEASTLEDRPMGDWRRETGGGFTSEGRLAGVPRPSRPTVAARPWPLCWSRVDKVWVTGWRRSWSKWFVCFYESLEPTFSWSISIQNQPNLRAFWTKCRLLWIEPVTARDGNGYPWSDTRWVFTPLGYVCGLNILLVGLLLGKNLHPMGKRVLERSTFTHTR
jgi:hypothetical protein